MAVLLRWIALDCTGIPNEVTGVCTSYSKFCWTVLHRIQLNMDLSFFWMTIDWVLFLFFSSLSQVSGEFQRITTLNIEPKFMAMLDLYTPKLLSLFHVKRGATGERHRAQMSVLFQVLKFIPHQFNFKFYETLAISLS